MEDRIGSSHLTRRRALGIVTAGGAGLLATLPKAWTRPVVDTIIVPLHAQGSPATGILLNSGTFGPISNQGEGRGRGIGVFMLASVNLTSIGIQADLQAKSFDVQVYASATGSDAGALLVTASANIGGAGYQWWDIPIAYTLLAGSYYVLHFRPTVDADGDWLDDTGTGLQYYQDSVLPVDVGPFRLVNGEEGYSPDSFGNTLHPDLRVNG